MAEQQYMELVYIQTKYFAVTIKGSASHPSLPGLEFKERESMLMISCEGEYHAEIAGDAEQSGLQKVGGSMTGSRTPSFFYSLSILWLVRTSPLINSTRLCSWQSRSSSIKAVRRSRLLNWTTFYRPILQVLKWPQIMTT